MDDFTRVVDAMDYDIDENAFDEEGGLAKITSLVNLFDPNLSDG